MSAPLTMTKSSCKLISRLEISLYKVLAQEVSKRIYLKRDKAYRLLHNLRLCFITYVSLISMAMIYIIGNHKQSIVYNDQWFDCKSLCCSADYRTYPRWRNYLERHVG